VGLLLAYTVPSFPRDDVIEHVFKQIERLKDVVRRKRLGKSS